MDEKFYNNLKNGKNNPPFLLAVSAGLDSMVMLNYFRKSFKNKSKFFAVAHVNYKKHMLANKAEQLIQHYCNSHNIPSFIKKYENKQSKGSFENIARKVRYEYFYDLCNKYGFRTICTAHHRDDQIETLFMKKIQGGDSVSFSGVREQNGLVWRPFLNLKKNHLKKQAKAWGLQWVEDLTNNNTTYLRNRIRHIDLPCELKKNPMLVNDLFAKKIKSDRLISLAKSKFEKSIIDKNIIIKKYSSKFVIIFRQLLNLSKTEIKLFIHFSFNNYFKIDFSGLTNLHWETFLQFLQNSSSGSEFVLFGIYKVANDRGNFCLYNGDSFDNLVRVKIEFGENNWISGKISVNTEKYLDANQKNLFVVSQKKWAEGLYIRTWESGDRINIIDRDKTRKLSDIYVDGKLSIIEKKLHPVIVNKNNEPVWLPGIRHSSCSSISDRLENKYLIWQPS